MKHVLSLALGLVLFQSCQKQQVIVNVENPKVTFQKQIERNFVDTIKDANNKPFPVPFKVKVSIKKGDEFDYKDIKEKTTYRAYNINLSIDIIDPIDGWYFAYEIYNKKGELLANNNLNKIKTLKLNTTLNQYPFKKNEEYTLKFRIKAYGSIVNIPESYFEFKIED